MIAAMCNDPTTAEVVQQTVLGLGGMALAGFFLFGFYKLIKWGGE